MKHYKRSLLIGLMGLASGSSAQTMMETVTSVGIQNTLQSAAAPSLKVPALPPRSTPEQAAGQAAQSPAVQPPAAPTSGSAAAPGTSVPATPVTPLTAEQQERLAQARSAFQAGAYVPARDAFEALVAQNYTNPEPHFGLALALFALNNDKGAAFELGQFIALAPDRYEGPYNLGVLAGRRGDHEQALQLYTQAAGLMSGQASAGEQRQVLEALAAEQTRKQDYAALSTTLAAVAALAADDVEVAYRLAQARTLAGQGTLALPGVYALLQRDGSRLDAALLLADIYVAQDLPDRAARELDAAVLRAGNGTARSALLLRKAEILAAGGDTRAALSAAEDAAREDQRNAAAFARIGEWRAARNDRAGALGAYISAVKLDPKNASYRTDLAAVRLNLGRYAEAANDTLLTLKLRPDESVLTRALFIQGVAAYRQGQYARAVTALKSSQTRRPDAETALWLGLSAYARQDYPAAADALTESVRLSPTPTARLNLASALLASARYPEAEAVLRGLVTEDPKAAETWYMLGLAQRSQRHEEDARQSLKTAANLGSSKARDALKQ